MSINATTLSPAEARLSPAQLGKVDGAARDFEAVFLSEMFGHVFGGMESDPLFGGGRGEQTWHKMMVNEYAKNMAHGRGTGLSDQIRRAMIDMQAKADGAKT